MNHAEIENEYIKSTCKTRTVSELAKKYGVSQSDIIFELLKTGYNFDELKRGNPGAYKPAVKKYERWKKSGGTLESESDEDVLKQYEEKQPEQDEDAQETFSAEQIIDMQKEEIAKLQKKVSELDKKIESMKVKDFNETIDGMVEESKLKSKVDELTEKLSAQEQLTEDTMRLLNLREDELKNRKHELEQIKTENDDLYKESEIKENMIADIFNEAIVNHEKYNSLLVSDKFEAVLGAIKEYKNKIFLMESELSGLKDSLQMTKQKCESGDAERGELLKKLNDAETRLLNIQNNQSLSLEQDEAEEIIENKEELVQELNGIIEDLNEEVKIQAESADHYRSMCFTYEKYILSEIRKKANETD